jgi:hypothetical protein
MIEGMVAQPFLVKMIGLEAGNYSACLVKKIFVC